MVRMNRRWGMAVAMLLVAVMASSCVTLHGHSRHHRHHPHRHRVVGMAELGTATWCDKGCPADVSWTMVEPYAYDRTE